MSALLAGFRSLDGKDPHVVSEVSVCAYLLLLSGVLVFLISIPAVIIPQVMEVEKKRTTRHLPSQVPYAVVLDFLADGNPCWNSRLPVRVGSMFRGGIGSGATDRRKDSLKLDATRSYAYYR